MSTNSIVNMPINLISEILNNVSENYSYKKEKYDLQNKRLIWYLFFECFPILIDPLFATNI